MLWLASDWPIHDIAEERLYSVHMVQHLLLSYVAAPLFLLATPTWLARLVVGEGRWLRHAAATRWSPAVLFNAVIVFLPLADTVNASVENGGRPLRAARPAVRGVAADVDAGVRPDARSCACRCRGR